MWIFVDNFVLAPDTHKNPPLHAYAQPHNMSRVDAAEVEKWSCEQVGKWLRHNGLHHLAATFLEQRVDGYVLLRVTDNELSSVLNCRAFGDRKRILEFVASVQPKQTWPPKKAPSRPSGGSKAEPATEPEPERRRSSAKDENNEQATNVTSDGAAGAGAGPEPGSGAGGHGVAQRRVRGSTHAPVHSPIVSRRANNNHRHNGNNNHGDGDNRSLGRSGSRSGSRMFRSTSAMSVRQRQKHSPERPKFRTMSTVSKDALGGPGPGGTTLPTVHCPIGFRVHTHVCVCVCVARLCL